MLKAIGKSVLLTTGFAWGICATLKHAKAGESEEKEWEEIEGRLDRIERAIDAVVIHANSENLVTTDELEKKLQELKHRIDGEVDAKFECQSLSVEGLRTMIRHTDSLLERVLNALGDVKDERVEEGEPVSISTE